LNNYVDNLGISEAEFNIKLTSEKIDIEIILRWSE
jgi:hypothetical protein